ncbi:MAG: S8 family serine peptidase [Saprospiraceae bacterium]
MKPLFSIQKFFMLAAFLLMVICIATTSTLAQQKNYQVQNIEGIQYFKLDTSRILVGFDASLSTEARSAKIKTVSNLLVYDANLEFHQLDATVLIVKPGVTSDQVIQLLVALNDLSGMKYAAPFLLYRDGTRQGVLDQVNVGLKQPGDLLWLEKTCKEKGLETPVQNEFDKLIYSIKIPENRMGRALDIADALQRTGKPAFAEVNFLLIMKPHTNDPLQIAQWSQKNNGQYWNGNAWVNVGVSDADMDVEEAWSITTGSASVKVAVLDEGVDIDHPDLIANMLSGYDATGLGGAGNASNDDSHGTACAGMIAAKANNAIGLAGNAYNCKIIPVRIAYTPVGEEDWYTTNSWQANAINWSWQTAGASVLSNSWGGGSASTLVSTAITNAVTNGRNGKGAPVLFSAGNDDNSSASYPSLFANAIAVGASSMCDTRKSPTSCDGEDWWGSNYGTGLDVSAPGVKIITTDIAGSAGSVSGDYTAAFNGTSAACPNAASVVALMLSVNPNLTAAQARNILESTCQKVGGYSYSTTSGQPNGTWTSQMGYGRVNAQAACLAAQDNGNTCNAPTATQLSASNITNTSARLNCSVTGVQAYDWRYRKVGVTAWTDLNSSTTNYADISSLQVNSQYEFQISVRCNATLWSSWSASKTFSTTNTTTCNAPTTSQISATNIATTTARLNCSVTGVQAFDWSYRAVGASTWVDLAGGSTNYFDLTGLAANTQYEFVVAVRCGTTTWSNWSASKTFTTLNVTCNAPTTSQISATNIATTTARLNCSVTGVQAFDWSYRAVGASTWVDLAGGSTNYFDLTGLAANTQYEFVVAVRCGTTTWSNWSASKTFTTSTANSNNDNPCSAIQLTASNSCNYVNGDNTAATATYSGSTCGTSSPKDVWFQCTIPASGLVTFRTSAGTLNDAVMAIYWGSSCSSLNYIVCEDDNTEGNGSAMPVIGITGQAGTQLWIRVWGYNNATGSFSICALNYNSGNLADGDESGVVVYAIEPQQQTGDATLTDGSTEDPVVRFEENTMVEHPATQQDSKGTTGNLFPNPAKEQALLPYTLTHRSTVQITVCDLFGRVVQRQTLDQNSGKHQATLDLNELITGTYVVHFRAGDLTHVQTLQVVR